MARCSSFNNSSHSFTDVKIEVFDECEERLKRLFDEALLIFLKEEVDTRPLPVILGNGKTVDLFKLFVLVREREGFDSVSRKGLWESVAEELGFDCSVSPTLRLIYSKYLNKMEKWAVEKSGIVNSDSQDSTKNGCYGGLLNDLGDGFKGLLENGKCGERKRAMGFGCKHIEESRKKCRASGHDDKLEISCVALSDDSSVSAEEEGLVGMLKWLTSVARCPHDPSIGVIPHCSKWKKYTGNKSWIQVARARKALLVQRDNARFRYQKSPLLGHQTVHPSMYEDDRRPTGRLRSSLRRLSKPKSSWYSNGSLVSLTTSGSTKRRELTTTTPERTDLIAGTDLQVSNMPEIPRRYVAVGSRYQAQVNEWTEPGEDSDTKWLGTLIWSPENEEALDDTLGNDVIVKGRSACCSCDVLRSGSVECIRFHIAEKRMELRRDLGDAFFHWRFNQMGEEVSLRWTEREEKKFKDMMISDPKGFWENAAKCFKGKKREELVSYFYNVFLINRRRYQNRVTPKDVSSDDEGAFGAVGGSFGSDAVTSFGSETVICTLNMQCQDLD